MLKIKLQQQPESNTWYRVKINGEIIDHGVLQDTEETLCYKGLKFSNSTRTFVSISCTHDRELVVKELHMYDSRVIVGNTWDTDQIASAASADISDVINGNFDSIVMSSSVGGNKEWIFVIESDETISLWTDGDFSNNYESRPPELRNGFHIYEYSDGTVYEGEFSDDAIEGPGRMTLPNGTLLDGEFRNGKFTHGTRLYTDSTKEIGKFSGEGVHLELIKGIIIDNAGRTLKINNDKGENQ